MNILTEDAREQMLRQLTEGTIDPNDAEALLAQLDNDTPGRESNAETTSPDLSSPEGLELDPSKPIPPEQAEALLAQLNERAEARSAQTAQAIESDRTRAERITEEAGMDPAEFNKKFDAAERKMQKSKKEWFSFGSLKQFVKKDERSGESKVHPIEQGEMGAEIDTNKKELNRGMKDYKNLSGPDKAEFDHLVSLFDIGDPQQTDVRAYLESLKADGGTISDELNSYVADVPWLKEMIDEVIHGIAPERNETEETQEDDGEESEIIGPETLEQLEAIHTILLDFEGRANTPKLKELSETIALGLIEALKDTPLAQELKDMLASDIPADQQIEAMTLMLNGLLSDQEPQERKAEPEEVPAQPKTPKARTAKPKPTRKTRRGVRIATAEEAPSSTNTETDEYILDEEDEMNDVTQDRDQTNIHLGRGERISSTKVIADDEGHFIDPEWAAMQEKIRNEDAENQQQEANASTTETAQLSPEARATQADNVADTLKDMDPAAMAALLGMLKFSGNDKYALLALMQDIGREDIVEVFIDEIPEKKQYNEQEKIDAFDDSDADEAKKAAALDKLMNLFGTPTMREWFEEREKAHIPQSTVAAGKRSGDGTIRTDADGRFVDPEWAAARAADMETAREHERESSEIRQMEEVKYPILTAITAAEKSLDKIQNSDATDEKKRERLLKIIDTLEKVVDGNPFGWRLDELRDSDAPVDEQLTTAREALLDMEAVIEESPNETPKENRGSAETEVLERVKVSIDGEDVSESVETSPNQNLANKIATTLMAMDQKQLRQTLRNPMVLSGNDRQAALAFLKENGQTGVVDKYLEDTKGETKQKLATLMSKPDQEQQLAAAQKLNQAINRPKRKTRRELGSSGQTQEVPPPDNDANEKEPPTNVSADEKELDAPPTPAPQTAPESKPPSESAADKIKRKRDEQAPFKSSGDDLKSYF